MSTRRIPASAFRDDDGVADARLVAALALFGTDPAHRAGVLAALHAARVLAPVVATPAYDDDLLAGELRSALATEPAVAAAWLLPAPGVDARLTVRLVDGAATQGGVASLLASLARRVADLPAWAGHGVRGLDVALPPPDETPEGLPVFQRPPA